MPYIEQFQRNRFDELIAEICKALAGSSGVTDEGELNYVITSILIGGMKEFRYRDINKVIGVLECAKLEFYRRLAAPYETDKAKLNGDVYD